MANTGKELNEHHIAFIEAQHVFFVATAASKGTINISPKGLDSLRIVSPSRIAWLNLTGSGNETSAHVQENGRMTLMFCSFTEKPMILRVYGKAKVIHPRDGKWQSMMERFPGYGGTRQFFELDIEQVLSSCGFGVPFMEFTGTRENMEKWIQSKGAEGIQDYWKEKNQYSIDGLPTHILDDETVS